MSSLDELKQSLSQILEKLADLEGQLNATRQELETRLGPQGSALDELLKPGTELEQINASVGRLLAGTSQDQILETYLNETSTLTERSALFLAEEGVFKPWKASGLAVDALTPLASDDVSSPLVRAASEKSVVVCEQDLEQSFPWLAGSDPAPRIACCVPLVLPDVVPAVFYGDSTQAVSVDSLELLTQQTVMVLQNRSLEQLAAEAEQKISQAEQSAAEAAQNAAAIRQQVAEAEQRAAAAEEKAAAAERAAAEAAAPPPSEPAAPPEPAPADPEATLVPPPSEEVEEKQVPAPAQAAPPEAPPREAQPLRLAGSDSEKTAGKPAFKLADSQAPAQAPTAEPEPSAAEEAEAAPPAAEPAASQAAAAPAEAELSEEEKQHQDAKKLSRLLVSEFRLHQREKIAQGTEEKNIYGALKPEIDAARQEYEQKVHPNVAAKKDYYHEELVHILADGDESLMGPEYPGAMVRAMFD